MDCGQEVADWFSDYLGTRCRLLYLSEQLPHRELSEDPDFGPAILPGEAVRNGAFTTG